MQSNTCNHFRKKKLIQHIMYCRGLNTHTAVCIVQPQASSKVVTLNWNNINEIYPNLIISHKPMLNPPKTELKLRTQTWQSFSINNTIMHVLKMLLQYFENVWSFCTFCVVKIWVWVPDSPPVWHLPHQPSPVPGTKPQCWGRSHVFHLAGHAWLLAPPLTFAKQKCEDNLNIRTDLSYF